MTHLRTALAGMHPAYFALVMATGIVSIAADLAGLSLVAAALFYFNVFAYLAIWGLFALRLVCFPARFFADLVDHGRGVGFFTSVAGTGVLGAQTLLLIGNVPVAVALFGVAVVLWLFLTYSVFTAFTVKQQKPPLSQGLHGGWLLVVVATQSLAVLGAAIAVRFDPAPQPLLFAALALWLGGGMLYVWIISLIFYRYTFFPMSPGDLSPPYWINMGAMAISTLAGAFLLIAAPAWQLLAKFEPVIGGLTVAFWATATWWVPMLVILGIWRHGYHRFPLRYDPLYWGAVFPLGMYSACTFRLAAALDLTFLRPLAFGFAYIAMFAWSLVALGLVHTLIGLLRSPPGQVGR